MTRPRPQERYRDKRYLRSLTNETLLDFLIEGMKDTFNPRAKGILEKNGNLDKLPTEEELSALAQEILCRMDDNNPEKVRE